MREIVFFIASLAGAAILTALAVLIRPESPLWKFLLWGGISIFIACACIVLIDYYRPNGPKIFLCGIGIGVALLVGCSIAFFQNERPLLQKITLKRLIAYGRLDLIVPWNGTAPQFHGYNVGVMNVSDDTITARVMFLNVDVDGTKVMGSAVSSPVIVPQTQGTIFQYRRTPLEDTLISLDAKTITVEFEVDYDTIPESGIRRSYRKITYPLNWANGKNSAPLLEPQTVEEWER